MAYPQQQHGAPPFNPGYAPPGQNPPQMAPPPYDGQQPQVAPPYVGGVPPDQGYYPQQQGYPPPQQGYPAPGPGGYQQYPGQQHTTVVYTQPQPTTYVQQDNRKKDTSAEECALCALCAACICCCLLND